MYMGPEMRHRGAIEVNDVTHRQLTMCDGSGKVADIVVCRGERLAALPAAKAPPGGDDKAGQHEPADCVMQEKEKSVHVAKLKQNTCCF